MHSTVHLIALLVAQRRPVLCQLINTTTTTFGELRNKVFARAVSILFIKKNSGAIVKKSSSKREDLAPLLSAKHNCQFVIGAKMSVSLCNGKSKQRKDQIGLGLPRRRVMLMVMVISIRLEPSAEAINSIKSSRQSS